MCDNTPDALVGADDEVRTAVPLLTRATPYVGHFQIRTRGTLGGSIAHADPAGEYPAVASALDAEMEAVSPSGRRVIPAAEFFTGLWETALEPDEVLAAVRFPVWEGRCGFAVEEFARRHGDFAIAGAAIAVKLDDDNLISRCGIGLLGLGSTPHRGSAAEEAVVGRPVSDLSPDEIGELAMTGLEGIPADLQGSVAYRIKVASACWAWAPRRIADRRAEEAVVGRPVSDLSSAPRWWRGPGHRPPRTRSMHELPVEVSVNGRDYQGYVEPRVTLTDFLRERCGLTGTHLGCEHGAGGACTVLLDGQAVRSCLLFAVQVDGQEVTTVEGIASPDGELSPVPAALRECHGLQCGSCTPGFVTSITALLRDNPKPSDEEIREGLSGNFCRCTGNRASSTPCTAPPN